MNTDLNITTLNTPQSQEIDATASENVVTIRTSDRGAFRSCRRRWKWTSHLHEHLEIKRSPAPLWYGTAMHYALEDYHGHKIYNTITDAFNAFVYATKQSPNNELPDIWKDLWEMGYKLLEYYVKHWEPFKGGLKTYIHEGVPQVEVNFLTDLPFDIKKHYPDSPYDKAVYSGTIDRVIVDEYDQLWIVDYKTAAKKKESGYLNDPQISAYCYFGTKLYNRPIAGMIYWQFMKSVPKGPAILSNGNISTNRNQSTSSELYKKTMEEVYGNFDHAPKSVIECYTHFASAESTEHDRYISRTKVNVNQTMLDNEGQKILLELEDILNPNLVFYPNPNWMCANMCSFYEICCSVDDGSDWQQQLNASTVKRTRDDNHWVNFLPAPDEMEKINALFVELTHTPKIIDRNGNEFI